MEKLVITKKDVGKEYLDALKVVIKIRKQRRKIYGDSYDETPLDVEVWEIFQKTHRLVKTFKSKNVKYENLRDIAADICNYSLFLLAKSGGAKK